MSRVFVVNEPLQFNHATKQLERKMDLRPAAAFGELVFLTTAGQEVPMDPTPMIDHLALALEDFTDDDFLLPVGHPLLIGWATALAALYNNGRVRSLLWVRAQRCYAVVDAQLPVPDNEYVEQEN